MSGGSDGGVAVIAVACAVLCGAAAGALWPGGSPRSAQRLARILPVLARPSERERPVRHASPKAGGGPLGLIGGVVVAIGCVSVLARMEPKAQRRRRARLVADLPLAVDLLAACLRGGVSWVAAV